MMVLSAMSNIFPSPRSGNYLFDRQLLFLKGDSGGSEDTCAGGDECQGLCDLDASCDTDACRGACPSPDDARDCGCTTTAKCWNVDCQAQCSQDYPCESEDCQAACNGEDEEKACGCTEPQPACSRTACADKCLEDPECKTGSSCANTCLSPFNALACGCGVEDECFNGVNGSCFRVCKDDPICETQSCQDACVTTANTINCGCGCIKAECGRQCEQDHFCITNACQEACGRSLGLEEACGCALLADRPTEEPTNQPTEQPIERPMNKPTNEPMEEPTNKPMNIQPTDEPTNQPTEQPIERPMNKPTNEPTEQPTEQPIERPMNKPTEEPTNQPTNTPEHWDQDKRGQGGLTLQIQNALDDTWTEEFEIAIKDWESGDPDSLTLPTVKVSMDRACSQVSGVMKVCNGNYGQAGWLGINELMIITDSNVIVSSVAKMNEYYLLNADFTERRYTMCHEIGHGFGLPHTDENFMNQDLGNCLDYTMNHQNNILPGQVNFDKLVDLYGRAGAAIFRVAETVQLSAQERATYEEVIQDLMFEIADGYSTSSSSENSKRESRGDRYERNLGNGYTLVVNVLPPIP
jgi:hypothetical protein